jgi:hypothetical protein
MRPWLLLLAACNGAAPSPVEPDVQSNPYGMPTAVDGITYAGVAVIDLTPEIGETFTDVDGNAHFGGCLDDPAGNTEDCPEPFDDVDGDGVFEPVWIGGYDYLRPANGVREGDGISARAIVLVRDGAYVAFAVADLIGLAQNRLDVAAAMLEADGFDPWRFMGSTTHNHQGPDSLGLWGDPFAGVPGFDEAYQDRVAMALYEAVKQAASNVEPVELTIGAEHMRDRSPWFNGSVFGGKNPTAKMHGMVNDIRDPVIVSDQVLAIQAKRADDSVLFTFTNWSGHPEVRGDENNLLSSDWVGVTRDILEDRYGGVAVHMPESLGGMQSALGGELPLVALDGTHAWEVCTVEAVADAADDGCFGKAAGDDRTDADGDTIPIWATRHTWEYTISHGWHIAEAAMDALDGGEALQTSPIRIDYEDSWVAVHNVAYNLLGPQGLFDVALEDAVTDAERCPEASADVLGCLPFRTSRVQIGDVTFVTAPGELFPELAWGVPTDDPMWVAESADPSARGPGSRYFPQHDNACDTLDWSACRSSLSAGDCDCTKVHAWPYDLSDDAELRPVLDYVDTPYKAALSSTQQYLSYIVPAPSANPAVSLFTDAGDHYEDTVSVSYTFAEKYLQAQKRIADRW